MFRVIVILSLLLPAVSSAQQPADTQLREVIQQAQAEQWTVRVQISDSSTIAGKVREVGVDNFIVDGIIVRFASITRVQRRRREMGAGPWIGGAIGAALGYFVIGFSSPDSSCDVCGITALGLIGFGVVLGAIASQRVEWDTLWSSSSGQGQRQGQRQGQGQGRWTIMPHGAIL